MRQQKGDDFPIYMHVNYLEHVLPLDEIIQRCAAVGYDGIELRAEDSDKVRSGDDYLRHVFEQTDKAGLGLTFGCQNDTVNPDPGKRDESLKKLQEMIAFAADHDIHVLNVFAGLVRDPAYTFMDFERNGSAYATAEQWDMTVDYFRRAGAFAAQKGVVLCFETHNCYIHDLAQPTARLLERIGSPSVKANFDFGNIFLNKNNQGLEQEVQTLAGRIGYVHLKNLGALRPYFDKNYFWGTSLRNGAINNYLLMRQLIKTGYRGILTIENISSGDKRPLMADDLSYLRDVLADLGAA